MLCAMCDEKESVLEVVIGEIYSDTRVDYKVAELARRSL